MNLIETIKQFQEDAKTALNKKARNGDDLSDAELKKLKADAVVYWINKPAIADTGRAIFISVKIPRTVAIGKGDNRTAFRRARAYIDVITLKSSTDPKLLNTLESIEKEFELLGYTFEQNREAELDSQSGRTIWSFEISKTI